MHTPSFEESLRIVESIVQKLENPDIPLEEALSLFEEGVRHLRNCENLLKEARRKVTLLLEEGEEPFPVPEEND
jgi:exodeoxyribonuclease VII small subunit